MKNEELDYDSSDEEEIINTVGNIPIEYYNECDHIGYDTEGRPILKPETKKAIDKYLEHSDNVIKDPKTGQSIKLSDDDIQLIRKISSGQSLFERCRPDDLVEPEIMETPVTLVPPSKLTFIPSLDERKKVSKLVNAIKLGRMKMPEPIDHDKAYDLDNEHYMNYFGGLIDAFSEDFGKKTFKNIDESNLQWLHSDLLTTQTRYQVNREYIPVEMALPTNNSSYRCAPEYLLNDDEIKKLKSRFYDPCYNPCKHPNEKPLIPKQIPNLRCVREDGNTFVGIEKHIRDSIMAPRIKRKKVNMTSEQLLNINNPLINVDVKPYPNEKAITLGINEQLIEISINDDGFIATVSYQSIRIYSSNILIRKYPIDNIEITDATLRNPRICWIANSNLLAVAINNVLKIINPNLSDDSIRKDEGLEKCYKQSQDDKFADNDEGTEPKKRKTSVNWDFVKFHENGRYTKQLSYFKITHDDTILDMNWQLSGTYFLTIVGANTSSNSTGTLILHNLNSCSSYPCPLADSASRCQLARFSPIDKFSHKLYTVTTSSKGDLHQIMVFDLRQKKVVMKGEVLDSPYTMELSKIDEDILALGTFKSKIYLYNLQISARPFKSFNINQDTIRSISFSEKYPLVSCSTANGSVVVIYIKVDQSDDLLDTPKTKPVHQFIKLDKSTGSEGGDLYSIKFIKNECGLIVGGKSGNLYSLHSTHLS